MKKIPTIFERDWEGDRSRVLDKVTPGCEWVFAGEGVATKKYDGSACLIKDGKLYRRHEVKPGKSEPAGIFVASDSTTGKTILWLEVGPGPEDKWHREAMVNFVGEAVDGTYELVGPKVQGNPEHLDRHMLLRHATAPRYEDLVRTFDGIREALENYDAEGFVFHHPDGRMAKIKARDFGIKRSERFAHSR